MPETPFAGTLRPATERDADAVCRLILDLAAYEKAGPDDVATTPEAVRAALAPDAVPALSALLAFDGDGRGGGDGQEEPVGLALFYPAYSTWRANWGVYLEDLFVRPEHRGRGVGLALFRAVAASAVAGGADRLDWVVLNWNRTAIDFYEALGAEAMTEWTGMRLSGDALARLSGGQRPAG